MRIITIEQLLDMLKKYNHKELHIHHTWKPEHKNFNGRNGIQLQINMRNYHVNTNKWSDIGQHVTLLPDGTFVTGRDFGKNPASIKGFNTGAFCVEMLGNFDKGHDRLQGKQKESILRLARFFHDRGKYIRFHRENAPKTCPGTGIDKGQFMSEVKALGTAPITAVGTVTDSKEPTCRIIVNGARLDALGIIRDNLSYLPVLAVGNAAGVKVGFCNGKATLGKGELETTILIGETGYAQSREIAEVLGYLVDWDDKARTVKLTIGKR